MFNYTYLHLDVILPMIGSFFSYTSTNLSHHFCGPCWLKLKPLTGAILLNFSNNTEIVSPILIFSERPILFNSLISNTGSDFRPLQIEKQIFL